MKHIYEDNSGTKLEVEHTPISVGDKVVVLYGKNLLTSSTTNKYIIAEVWNITDNGGINLIIRTKSESWWADGICFNKFKEVGIE